jgi:hypothetical protein
MTTTITTTTTTAGKEVAGEARRADMSDWREEVTTFICSREEGKKTSYCQTCLSESAHTHKSRTTTRTRGLQSDGCICPGVYFAMVWWIFQHRICFGGVEIPLVSSLAKEERRRRRSTIAFFLSKEEADRQASRRSRFAYCERARLYMYTPFYWNQTYSAPLFLLSMFFCYVACSYTPFFRVSLPGDK